MATMSHEERVAGCPQGNAQMDEIRAIRRGILEIAGEAP
jgi:hypothetical protein